MKNQPFIHENFLLDSPAARELYHGYAAACPIIDYHCHLPPQAIADDVSWDNLSDLWLGGDHYKWRAMRTAGVAERYCTGDAEPEEKFAKYAWVMPQLLRNPLYHWSQLELARYFGIYELLNPDTAPGIYSRSREQLKGKEFTSRQLMNRSGVQVVCTTDDPADSLEHHQRIARDDSFDIQVRPTWRPDKALLVDQPAAFADWLDELEQAAGVSIQSLSHLMEALQKRHDFFAAHGCLLSDRGVDTVWAEDCTEREAAAIFAKARAGNQVTPGEAVSYKSRLLHDLAVMDAEKGWTMQIHYGALRGANTRMKRLIGADCGFDSIGDLPVAANLAKHLDRLDVAGVLPRTIIYNLNPRDNELVATMIGNFQDGITPGKIQFGSGWWFLDQLDGMTRQMESLSQLGLLSRFVGMLTDSRSFLSYARHEYFRRLLCNILGDDIERGRIPRDFALVGKMVVDISYHNARKYFGFFDVE